jgi:glutamate--cysteine ligase
VTRGPDPVIALARSVRERLFARARAGAARQRVGIEVELIPVLSRTGEVCPIESREQAGPSTSALLRSLGRSRGWREEQSPKAGRCGAPRFVLPDGSAISFEPGGQIEISSLPHASVSDLVATTTRVIDALRHAAAERGITLLQCGIDPLNDIDAVPLQLDGDRYVRMTEFFETLGPFGVRMMRQTAALQISVDGGTDPERRWRLLGDMAPYLTAMFANSRWYAGADSGDASHRASCWRALDPSRTGVPAGDDPAEAYARFALDAIDLMRRDATGSYHSYRYWAERGAWSVEGWETHLSTLFPEVRPRGHLEVRCIDALPTRWLAVPIVLVCGLAYDPASAAAARDLVPAVDERSLLRAATQGLADPAIARVAYDLAVIGLRGARALGESFVSGDDLEVTTEYVDRYTRRGRAPADGPPPGARLQVRAPVG